MIQITQSMLDPISVTESVRNDANGAVVTFVGTTRRTSEGKQVLYLEYEGYEAMATKKLEQICQDIKTQWPMLDLSIMHRLGRLEIEDISLVVAVASPHRKEAFDACSHVVDRIKEIVPIWKKEVFEDGEAWVGCQSHQIPTVTSTS
ncbi:molybdenum cofactor biosynthesis protein MoaE [SAR202 cluster bacterium AD-804-J14_MRT_500m]|nr:molybdenum cofactor biosynthesis protein MoaE [SAR202 cluster bacterium AD-804-J14_MRT_500m]MQF69955.1 molybdenum cofactor biosynthesis protein MoaE [SAR202 cluster bacterium AD-804-J14_MRT_500m]